MVHMMGIPHPPQKAGDGSSSDVEHEFHKMERKVREGKIESLSKAGQTGPRKEQTIYGLAYSYFRAG